MPTYLSACALVLTKRPEFPVYCLRHHAVDTASRWIQERFLASRIDPTSASYQCSANSSGHCFARWISFYCLIFSDIDCRGYLRKFTTDQALLAELTCSQ